MLDDPFHGELRGVKSVRLRTIVDRDVYNGLRALWKGASGKHDVLPFGNIDALAFLLKPLDSSEYTGLSSEGRQLFTQKTLTEGTRQSLDTPHGQVETYIENIGLALKRDVQESGRRKGTVYDAEKTEFSVQLRVSCEAQNRSLGSFTSETIASQTLSIGAYMDQEGIGDEIGALCSALVGGIIPLPQSESPSSKRLKPLEVLALIGGSGTGKTVGLHRISRMLSSLWSVHDTIPFTIHLSIYDIIPTTESVNILAHMEALNENLSRVFRTARLMRPFVLVFDDMHLLFSQRSVAHEHDDTEMPHEELGPYHPLLKNFLMHAVNAFIDEQSQWHNKISGRIVFVFQESAEIPSALKGPNRIFRVFDADLPNMSQDDLVILKAFNGAARAARHTPCTEDCLDKEQRDKSSAELQNVQFIRQNLQRLYGLRCFCCLCVGLKPHDESHPTCRPECCWVAVLAQYTRGWTKAELMGLISKSESPKIWSIRAAIDYAVSYTPLAIRRVVDCADTMRDTVSSSSPLVGEFVDFGGAWRKIQLLLLSPLHASLSTHRKEAVTKVPKGMLIHGRCGTGKTTLLSKIQETLQAQRGNINFSSCPGDIPGVMTNFPGVRVLRFDATRVISKYFGESEANLAALFRQARKIRPCVILADHIEQIIGMSRDISETSNYDERLLSTFLTEMSGLHSDEKAEKPLVFIGVTHYELRSLDPAALRAGRLELHVSLDEKIDAHDACRTLECFTQKIPNRVSEETFRAAGEYLTQTSEGNNIVIADIKQCSNQLAWRALSRGSDFAEDEDVRATIKGLQV